MTSAVQWPVEAAPEEARPRTGWMPELWGTVAIASMWLAVLFASVYGADFVSTNGSGATVTRIPSGVFVALFACLASVAVARRAYRRSLG
jgi:hypothetical protein